MKKCNLLNVLQYVVHMWTLHLYMHIKKKIIIALPYLVSNSKKNYLKKKNKVCNFQPILAKIGLKIKKNNCLK